MQTELENIEAGMNALIRERDDARNELRLTREMLKQSEIRARVRQELFDEERALHEETRLRLAETQLRLEEAQHEINHAYGQ